MNSYKAEQIRRYGRVRFPEPITMPLNKRISGCYNCEGQGKVSVTGKPICPLCKVNGKDCVCGSDLDFLPQFKIVVCPICKGQKDLFQG